MGKDKKKHKKKSSERKKRRKKSSSDESSSSNEWVESEVAPPPTKAQPPPPLRLDNEQDEWASNPALLACTSRDQLRQAREKKNEKNEQDKYMLDKLGRTDRELNPYWKDGGCGLPEESPARVETLRQAQVTVGDQGTAWLQKALQRAKEQAKESGRPLTEVVAERWGSLEKLESMIAAAEERDKNNSSKSNNWHRVSSRDDYRDRNLYNQRNRESTESKSSKKRFSKPRNSSEDSSDEQKNYRSKNCDERNSDRLRNSRDYRSDSKKLKEPNRNKFMKVEESSDSSDDSLSEETSRNSKHRKHKSKQRDRSKDRLKNKFSKPRSSSSSSSDSDKDNKYNSREYKSGRYEHERKSKSSYQKFSKPANSSDEDSYRRRKDQERKKFKDNKRRFAKPHPDNSDSEDGSYKSKSYDSKSRDYKSISSSGGGWRKKVETQKKNEEGGGKKHQEATSEINVRTKEISEVHSDDVEEDKNTSVNEVEPVLTDKELNDLGAKLVKAEILGNQELVEELKARLTKAREAKANAPKDSGGPKEVVILTQTDSKGFTRPVSMSGPAEPSGGRRKGKKVETHSGGKRVRYFADDDKYSLKEMFQREKFNTVEDSNEVFAKLASKGVGRDDSARDMEDVFEETARVEEGEGRQKAKERQKAIDQSRRTAQTLDSCQWCLDSQHMLKHLIVAIGSTCYLCVPPYQSLTEHHCLIVPRTHTTCATQLDEDVWTEVQDFRKAVVQMFLSLDEDVVFFESARRLNQFPHMVLNCVPVPKETGDMAPIYFKKAIQECEQEWSNNKKLVDLKGRDVRRAVPRGLPYFAVDFGLDSGYAHVIEDEQLFPQNFAQEIIGGMLDLDHSMWRKQRRQTFEEQSKKVIQLSKLWSPFDITKKK